MEFPKLGTHCSEKTCKQLDFLPMKCDACFQIFCKDHIQYVTHSCTESYKKDKQVPVCPLCNKPIPVLPSESADVKVSQHIDTLCQSDPAKERRKVYTNRCSHKGCKQKEMIPVVCEKCRLNFCLRHRHETDHNCLGFQGSGKSISNPGAAAVKRQQTNTQTTKRSTTPSSSTNHHLITQGHMTEDEAMAKAIALSLADGTGSTKHHTEQQITPQEREDAMLAAAIAASQTDQSNPGPNRRSRKSSCEIS